MFFLWTIASLFSSTMAQTVSPEFACFRSLSDFSDHPILFANKTAGIRRINPMKFQIITAGGVQSCEVPANAPIVSGGSKTTGPFYVSLKNNKQIYHLAYAKDKVETVQEQEAVSNNSQEAKCQQLTGPALKKTWKDILENAMSETRRECEPNSDRGMSREKFCLPEYAAAVKPCEKVSGEVSQIAREFSRSALQQHKNALESIKIKNSPKNSAAPAAQ